MGRLRRLSWKGMGRRLSSVSALIKVGSRGVKLPRAVRENLNGSKITKRYSLIVSTAGCEVTEGHVLLHSRNYGRSWALNQETTMVDTTKRSAWHR